MSPLRSTAASFWKLQALGWSGFFVAMTFSRLGRFPIGYMIASKLVLTALGVGASLVMRALLRPRLEAGRPMRELVLVSIVAAYLISMAWTAAHNALHVPIANALLEGTWRIGSIGALLSGTVYHAFALVAWGFLYIGIRHHEALQAERERALRAEALATEARLRALESQLDPHFLFNTLNAISTLVVERRTEQATAMISRLGDLLRATLRRTPGSRVPLAEELRVVERYLAIERERLEERLVVRVEVEPETRQALVPLLLLQPLVENAVRHGIAPVAVPGRLTIAARRQRDRLELEVSNTAPALARARDGDGVGLANVRERLAVLYPGRHTMHAAPRPGPADGGTSGFEVRITIPWELARAERDPAHAAAGERRAS